MNNIGLKRTLSLELDSARPSPKRVTTEQVINDKRRYELALVGSGIISGYLDLRSAIEFGQYVQSLGVAQDRLALHLSRQLEQVSNPFQPNAFRFCESVWQSFQQGDNNIVIEGGTVVFEPYCLMPWSAYSQRVFAQAPYNLNRWMQSIETLELTEVCIGWPDCAPLDQLSKLKVLTLGSVTIDSRALCRLLEKNTKLVELDLASVMVISQERHEIIHEMLDRIPALNLERFALTYMVAEAQQLIPIIESSNLKYLELCQHNLYDPDSELLDAIVANSSITKLVLHQDQEAYTVTTDALNGRVDEERKLSCVRVEFVYDDDED